MNHGLVANTLAWEVPAADSDGHDTHQLFLRGGGFGDRSDGSSGNKTWDARRGPSTPRCSNALKLCSSWAVIDGGTRSRDALLKCSSEMGCRALRARRAASSTKTFRSAAEYPSSDFATLSASMAVMLRPYRWNCRIDEHAAASGEPTQIFLSSRP